MSRQKFNWISTESSAKVHYANAAFFLGHPVSIGITNKYYNLIWVLGANLDQPESKWKEKKNIKKITKIEIF